MAVTPKRKNPRRVKCLHNKGEANMPFDFWEVGQCNTCNAIVRAKLVDDGWTGGFVWVRASVVRRAWYCVARDLGIRGF